MVNHSRTLLFNLSPYGKKDGSKLGELFIPKDFKSIIMKESLQSLYDFIIPPGVSRFQRNYILNVFMRILHQPKFEPYTLFFDSRITYDLNSQKYSKIFASDINIDGYKSKNSNIDFTYGYIPSNLSENNYLNWTIRNEHHVLFIESNKDSREILLPAKTKMRIDLIPKCLFIELLQNGDEPEGTIKYLINVKSPKLIDVAVIVSMLDSKLTGAAHIMRDLFQNSKCQEQLSLFKEIWLTSKESTDRLAAVLLSLIFNTHYV